MPRSSSSSSEQTRQRILEVAARLYSERGYSAVTARDVAGEAGVALRTVNRLFPEPGQLFAEAAASRASSHVAARMARQAREPSEPVLGVLLWAAREVFAAPERNWGPLELEAFVAARRDPTSADLVQGRLAERWGAMDEVVRQMRASGAIADGIDDRALVHFAFALSVGLALVDPVAPAEVDEQAWTQLMSRLLTALGPDTLERDIRSPSESSLWRIRVDVPDRVGAIEQLAHALTGLNAFVLTATTPGYDESDWRTIDLLVSCPDSLESADLRDTVGAVGRLAYVRAGDDDDRIDIATRVLDGVTQIVESPRSAPEQVARLVEADSFEVTDATTGSDDAAGVLRLQWTPTRHVVLRRSWAPFIHAEQARASAAMRLAAAMASSAGVSEAQGWVEPMRGGGTAWMRLAQPDDAAAVTAMHERCSERTIHQRYFRNITEWRDLTVRRLAGGHRGASIVVMSEDGRIIGLGNVFPTQDGAAGDEEARAAELALLIDDEHQGRGLGSLLLGHMIDIARRLGFTHVEASVLSENRGMIGLLERSGLDWHGRVQSGVTEFEAELT